MTPSERRAHLLVTAYLDGATHLDFLCAYEECVAEKRDEVSGAALFSKRVLGADEQSVAVPESKEC